MATDTPTARIRLASSSEARLAAGHAWIYQGNVDSVEGSPEAGDIVDIFTSGGRFVGRGLYNPQSKIRVRLVTRSEEPVDGAFWSRRLQEAVALRTRAVSGTTAYRVVHADGDGLPGLIVDRYGDTLVMQSLTVGMDRRREAIADSLLSVTGATALYLRNDAPARALEGLSSERLFLRGAGPTSIQIQEGPARFIVDIEGGQKTGWFCDQRDNRLAVASLARDKDVLDVFCHTGGFGVQAAVAGARSVAGLDASRVAVERASAHAALNQVAAVCDFRTADALDALKTLGRSRRRFDVVIVDPPAFAKRRAARTSALDGYRYVNEQAMKIVRPSGTLATCSCSHHVSEADLCGVVEEAAHRARRRVHIVERRGAGPDHPVKEAMPETRYLKCLIVTVN